MDINPVIEKVVQDVVKNVLRNVTPWHAAPEAAVKMVQARITARLYTEISNKISEEMDFQQSLQNLKHLEIRPTTGETVRLTTPEGKTLIAGELSQIHDYINENCEGLEIRNLCEHLIPETNAEVWEAYMDLRGE